MGYALTLHLMQEYFDIIGDYYIKLTNDYEKTKKLDDYCFAEILIKCHEKEKKNVSGKV